MYVIIEVKEMDNTWVGAAYQNEDVIHVVKGKTSNDIVQLMRKHFQNATLEFVKI